MYNYLFPAPSLSGQSLAASTSANFAFSASLCPGAQFFEVSVTTNNAFVTFDGTTPSATNGIQLIKDQPALIWPIDKAIAARIRSATGTSNIYGAPMVTWALRAETRSLSSELLTLSAYPIDPGF